MYKNLKNNYKKLVANTNLLTLCLMLLGCCDEVQ